MTDTPEKICDYCDETDPMRQAMCRAKECGVAVTKEEWAVREMNAEANLAKVIKAILNMTI